MAGNSIGQFFCVTTFGESHGPALGGIVDGVPPGIPLSEEDLQRDLDRRRPGTSRYTTQRREPDRVKILSGVFEGVTTGTSIGLLIENIDQRSQDYSVIKDLYRPGHADYSYEQKYGRRDYRGGGRSSARETVIRVAAGAIAKKYLEQHCGVQVRGFLAQMGAIRCELKDWAQVEQNPFFCPDVDRLEALDALMRDLKKAGDSIGAKVTVVAENLPAGLGEPVFDRLDADLAHALMSINAVKGVEIGDGFAVIGKRGSENRDEITPAGFQSNHAGGILGGISSGQPVIAHLALKPTSSIIVPSRTVNRNGEAVEMVTRGRHDPCVGIRVVSIAEAMMAIVLMDHLLRQRAQCADVVSAAPCRRRGKKSSIPSPARPAPSAASPTAVLSAPSRFRWRRGIIMCYGRISGATSRHPDLLLFIQRLSNKLKHLGLGEVLVGDMAMPAGGRFSSEHASHKSGLYEDIWLQMPRQRWSASQLLKPQTLDLVSANGRGVVPRLWQPQTAALIKLAEEDDQVTRIFVNPAIKKQLCLDAGSDRDWLRKVRPWFGHRGHMHVRLRCPPGSCDCVAGASDGLALLSLGN